VTVLEASTGVCHHFIPSLHCDCAIGTLSRQVCHQRQKDIQKNGILCNTYNYIILLVAKHYQHITHFLLHKKKCFSLLLGPLHHGLQKCVTLVAHKTYKQYRGRDSVNSSLWSILHSSNLEFLKVRSHCPCINITVDFSLKARVLTACRHVHVVGFLPDMYVRPVFTLNSK